MSETKKWRFPWGSKEGPLNEQQGQFECAECGTTNFMLEDKDSIKNDFVDTSCAKCNKHTRQKRFTRHI